MPPSLEPPLRALADRRILAGPSGPARIDHAQRGTRGVAAGAGARSHSVHQRPHRVRQPPDEGTLLIWNQDEVLVGHIEFFRPVNYWDAYELSYQLYGAEHTGKGYTTEAVRLLVDYLFAAKKVNRISLVIVPENAPSRRIAEKCGFQLEGTARGAFFNGGSQRRRPDLLAAP